MQEYGKMLRHFFDFNGRARRREYWVVNMINSGVAVLIYALMFFASTASGHSMIAQAGGAPMLNYFGSTPAIVLSGVYGLFSLYIFISSLALTVRRYHDAGIPGWAFPLCLLGSCLCGIGGIVHLVFCFLSSKEDNQYGVNPKAPGNNEYETNTSIWGSIVFYVICIVIVMVAAFINVMKCGIGEQPALNTFTQAFSGFTGLL